MTRRGTASHHAHPLDWMFPGAPVWYNPAMEAKPYAGTLDCEPFSVNGVLHVRVVDMDERYVKRCGRDRVLLAAWYSVRPRRPR
jgi:hypothetical protein